MHGAKKRITTKSIHVWRPPSAIARKKGAVTLSWAIQLYYLGFTYNLLLPACSISPPSCLLLAPYIKKYSRCTHQPNPVRASETRLHAPTRKDSWQSLLGIVINRDQTNGRKRRSLWAKPGSMNCHPGRVTHKQHRCSPVFFTEYTVFAANTDSLLCNW